MHRFQSGRNPVYSSFDFVDIFREKNAELEKVLAIQRQKEEDAEKTLADFKRKMEDTSKKMFDDAKIQVCSFLLNN